MEPGGKPVRCIADGSFLQCSTLVVSSSPEHDNPAWQLVRWAGASHQGAEHEACLLHSFASSFATSLMMSQLERPDALHVQTPDHELVIITRLNEMQVKNNQISGRPRTIITGCCNTTMDNCTFLSLSDSARPIILRQSLLVARLLVATLRLGASCPLLDDVGLVNGFLVVLLCAEQCQFYPTIKGPIK